MTVSYTSEAYSAGFGVYLRLLFRYRGSVYKMVWVEFFVFCALYIFVSLIYRLLLVDPSKTWFELCVISVSRVMHQIPIGFVLGFYVGLIYNRFWKSFLAIPSPNKTAMYLTTYLQGNDEEAILIRRTAVRYVCAAFVLALRTINIPIKKRFPSVELVCEAGLLTREELEMYRTLKKKCRYMATFIPLTWCAVVIRRAYDRQRIKSPALVDLIKIVDDFRGNCQTLFNYDTVNVPLCYTQAVTFGVYSYFIAAIIGYQFIPYDRIQLLREHGMHIPSDIRGDYFVPVFAIVQFFIYIGLMKVAEALLNPHGENDDDFELCGMVEKNLNNGNMIVTDMHNDLPEMQEDIHWNVTDVVIPHTVASEQTEKSRSTFRAHLGSLFDFEVKKGAEIVVSHISSSVRKTSSFLRINIESSKSGTEPDPQSEPEPEPESSIMNKRLLLEVPK